MDWLIILLIVLTHFAFGSWGYGSYYPAAGGAPASPMVNGLGMLAAILLIVTIVLLATGWRFGLVVTPPVP
jgi:hypothetical protein